MKIKKTTIFLLLSLSLLLSACGAPTMNGMPGIAVAGDTVYTSYGDNVTAVRAQDGVLVWRYPPSAQAGMFFFSEPAITDSLVVVGDYSNTLHGLDQGNGSETWTFKESKSRWIAGSVIVDDTILAPSDDGNLYALDNKGVKKWSFTTGHGIWTKPLVDGAVVYVVSMDHKIYALDLATGTEKWNLDLGSSVVRTPLLSEGVLYAGTLGGELVAVNLSEQKILWRYKADGALWFSPIIQDGVLYFGDVSGKMYALNAENAQLVWKLEESSAIMGSAGLFSDGVVFCSENGNVIAVSFKGEKMWSYPVPGKLYSGPIVAKDRIVVAVTQGETLLVGLDFRGGKQWSYLPPTQ